MIEWLATFFGRHMQIPGSGRVLGQVFPCRSDSLRYVSGTRSRGDGMLMELDTRQLIDWNLLFRGEYEPHLRNLFERLLESGAVAVDVGANVGAHTLTLARLVGSTGRVLAFEPNPAIRSRLERNVAMNSLENVDIYDCALGDIEAQMHLRVPAADSKEAANPGMASLVALDTPHDLVKVDVAILDGLWASTGLQRLDLVKIDVQGYEAPVVRGMAALIKKFEPVVIFEYEDWAWRKAGTSFDDIAEMFDQQSYALWQIVGRKGPELISIDRGQVPSQHADVLAVKRHDPRERGLTAATRGTPGD